MIAIVLEDAPPRVEWLRATFPDVEVRHHESVADFVADVDVHKNDPRLRVVVFDHDLGHSGGIDPRLLNYDKDGLTGADAARMIPPVECHAVVWSQNTTGASRIVDALVSKVGGKIIRCPFYTSSLMPLATALARVLS